MNKEQLRKYVGLKMEVAHQLERIARARSEERFPSMRENIGSQRPLGGSDRMGAAIIRRMDLEEKLTPIISAKLDEMERIERAINFLDDPMEREILRIRYIDGHSFHLTPWRDVALKVYGDDDESQLCAVHRLHGRALQHLRKIEV